MSTATINAKSSPDANSRAIFGRFVWKEYRLLRGLWLAVAVMGMIVQWAISILTPLQFAHASMLFCTALAAAVLYAVGAAATTFSVELEEETHGFLSGLPTTWWPVFAGKLLVAAVSAVALAGTLAFAGWVICGYELPGDQDTVVALGLFGVGIIEALAWGTLFSLLTKRPLVAALLTLIVGVTATQLAVSAMASSNTATGDPASYAAAVPQRLAFVVIVLGVGALVARRWLDTGTQRPRRVVSGSAWRPTFVPRVTEQMRRISTRVISGTRRRMLARLLWQTWRDSWKLLPLPIIVALVLSITASLLGFLTQRGEVGAIAVASTVFFAPALYGALVFSADQRRGNYRFLAEHAAWPSYVWLARHAIWLGAILVLITVGSGVVIASLLAGLQYAMNRLVDDYVGRPNWNYPSAQDMVFDLSRTFTAANRGTGLAGCGILAAYGIGQFWSMLVRSEILAAFVSVVLAAALSAWVAVLFVWHLPGWTFLLPLFAGLMLATWLRAPNWITDRHTWRAWLLPALAIAAPLILIGLLLPAMRLAQLPTELRGDNGHRVVADDAIANQLDWFRSGDSPEARETAAMYERAAEMLHSWQDNDLLERWGKPEYIAPVGGNEQFAEWVLGIDVSKIPANEQTAFGEAVEKLVQLERTATVAAIRLATEASLRPSCRFDFDIDQARPVRNDRRSHLDLDSVPLYRRMNELLDVVLFSPFNPDDPPKNLFAALRMSAHLRSGQPSGIFINQMKREQQILEQIAQWAFHVDRTDEQLRNAAEQLNESFRTSGLSPDENLLADHLLVADVLAGDVYPLALAEGPDDRAAYLAFLANQLGWERVRGLRALSLITLQNIDDANQLVQYLANQQPLERGNWQVSRWLRPEWYGDNWPQDWLIQQPAAASSYLTRFEYQTRVRLYDVQRQICDAAVYRQAALLKIALAMYRRDHDVYPESLAQLVPDYLNRDPVDPYSGRPFQYEPGGLGLPLASNQVPNLKTIDPGTPLFWSVGAGDASLQKRFSTRPIEGQLDPQGEPLQITQMNYVLAGVGQPWWNEPVFVFPLPK